MLMGHCDFGDDKIIDKPVDMGAFGADQYGVGGSYG